MKGLGQSDWGLVAALTTLANGCDSATRTSVTARPGAEAEERVYQVGRRISYIPEREDLSTPDTAVAALCRATVRGGSWRRFETRRAAAEHGTKFEARPMPAAYARDWLSQEILEVQIHGGTRGAVYRWQPRFWGAYFAATFLELHDGKGLWDGGDYANTAPPAGKVAISVCHPGAGLAVGLQPAKRGESSEALNRKAAREGNFIES